MKPAHILKIFLIAMFFLLALQGIWLHHAYQINLRNIQESVNIAFIDALEKEMSLRYLEMEKHDALKKEKGEFPEDGTVVATFESNSERIEEDGIMSEHFFIVQSLLKIKDTPFDIFALDSLYTVILKENNLKLDYRLTYRDSLNNVVDTTGKEINDGFKINPISIIDGKKIEAIIRITPSRIFMNMLGVLILSILVLILIVACLIYQTKVFLNQFHLNQLRDNFTHALTHNMKTPLGTIHVVIDQLNKGLLDNQPEIRNKHCAIATEQVLNLQALTNQILTLAYIEKKQLTLNKQPIELPQMIQLLIDKFSVQEDKTVEFKTHYDLKNVELNADPVYLSNALSNLFDNSIKYSGNEVCINIQCTASDKQVYIQVKDNGRGISKKDQEKIFERFERGVEIKRKSVSGFGLGLNYVKQVIEAHGGTIALFSSEGLGSEFTVTVPISLGTIEESDIV